MAQANPQFVNDPQLAQLRVPPHSIEAEQSVLGGLLLDNQAWERVADILAESNFYRDDHRRIYRHIGKLMEKNRPADMVTVFGSIEQSEDKDKTGGLAYLGALAQNTPSAHNIRRYAEIVRERAIQRKLIEVGTGIADSALNPMGKEVAKLLDEAESRVFEIAEAGARGHQGLVEIQPILAQVMERIDMLYHRDNPSDITGLATGFNDLDQKTSGLQQGDLIIVAGRPSMGKTAFALNIAEHVAVNDRLPVAVFSMEMGGSQLAMRMLGSVGRLDQMKLCTGRLTDEDWSRLTDAVGKVHDAPIHIDETPALNCLELRARARRMHRQYDGLGLVAVDYLQLMSSTSTGENRATEISEISRSLKALAKELKVPVVALSQLNRSLEQRPNKRPVMSDLRECVTGDTLASGRMIRATAEHRLFAHDGWRRVSQLAIGDRLAIARRTPEPAVPIVWPDHAVALLGHLVGDGSYLTHQPLRYCTASEQNSTLVREAAIAMGSTVTRYAGRGAWHQLLIAGNGDRWHPAGVGAWLKSLGIFGHRSHEKRLPAEVFRLSDRQVGLLLQHLWATDGCISLRRPGAKGAPRVYFSTCSLALARDVMALLLRLGIVARLRTTVQPGSRPVHGVDVSGVDDQRRFLDVVGAFGPRAGPAARLRERLQSTVANTNADTLPQQVFADVRSSMGRRGVTQRPMAAARGTSYGGTSHFRFAPSRSTLRSYATLLDDPVLARWAQSDLYWDRIVAIGAAGEEEVFDLTVPGPACWLADGIVSHNSGAIEQDADLILFIYRDEVYNPETQDKGTAEIIIGKQRNGPIGMVRLTFLGEFTRFENAAHPGSY